MSSSQFFITCGYEKLKDTLFVYHAETGDFLHKIMLKYPNFKEVAMVVALPDKPWQVALIDMGRRITPRINPNFSNLFVEIGEHPLYSICLFVSLYM